MISLRDKILSELVLKYCSAKRHRRDNYYITYTSLAKKLDVKLDEVWNTCREMDSVIRDGSQGGRVRLAHEEIFMDR